MGGFRAILDRKLKIEKPEKIEIFDEYWLKKIEYWVSFIHFFCCLDFFNFARPLIDRALSFDVHLPTESSQYKSRDFLNITN